MGFYVEKNERNWNWREQPEKQSKQSRGELSREEQSREEWGREAPLVQDFGFGWVVFFGSS